MEENGSTRRGERRRKGERERELKGRAVARAESVEGWLLLRLIQSTATLPVGRRSFRRISTRWWTEIVKQKSKKRKREENKTEQRERERPTRLGIQLGNRKIFGESHDHKRIEIS